jgi:hypothetical protein
MTQIVPAGKRDRLRSRRDRSIEQVATGSVRNSSKFASRGLLLIKEEPQRRQDFISNAFCERSIRKDTLNVPFIIRNGNSSTYARTLPSKQSRRSAAARRRWPKLPACACSTSGGEGQLAPRMNLAGEIQFRSFADNSQWSLIGAQRTEFVVPNVIRIGPFQKLKIRDEFRFHPNALFHLCGGQVLSLSTRSRSRGTDEWSGLHDGWLHLCGTALGATPAQDQPGLAPHTRPVLHADSE